MKPWIYYAFGSAFFAALVTIFGKAGVRGVDSNLGNAIRTTVAMGFCWAIVVGQGHVKMVDGIDARTWVFLALSGLGTGLSWMCYYRALQVGPNDAVNIAAIDKFSLVLAAVLLVLFFRDRFYTDMRMLAGVALITIGTILMIPAAKKPAPAKRTPRPATSRR